MQLLSAGSVCALAPQRLTFICSASKKGTSSCLTKHHKTQSLGNPSNSITVEVEPGLWVKDVTSDMVHGDTSIRENSNRFNMDDLSLFVFKSVRSQAVLVSPGGEV